MNVNGRLHNLERILGAGECPEPTFITHTRLSFEEYEKRLARLGREEDEPPCPRCGKRHRTTVFEIIVTRREQVERLRQLGVIE